jgi:ABC-type transport system involved in multi-copper enzyme maturation permease subunit
MRWHAIRSLLWKELRQVGRNRMALLTAAFLPFIILFLAPIQILFQLRLVGSRGISPTNSFPGIDITDPSQLALQLIYPLLFVLGGMLLPTLTTTYAIVAERERRSLELLVSLPVTVSEILAAKLLMVLIVTAVVGLPYVAVTLVLIVVLGLGGIEVVPALLAPFVAAVICSTAISLVLTLLARDFRSANNLNGMFFVPVLLLTFGVLALVTGPARTYALAAMLLAMAGLALVVAMRWITFERYLE